MPGATRSNASWERVLAAMEAEAARAAALLTADDQHAAAGIEYDGYDAPPSFAANPVDVPATWRLPAPGAAARSSAGFMTSPDPALPAQSRGTITGDEMALPDPATMPPLTPQLRQRLDLLSARITVLQADLAAAMAEAEEILARPSRPRAAPAPQPELVDRRV